MGLFTLALGSKTVTATLPAALLLVSWWRHGRLSWRRDVLPLMPFFALGVGAGLFTAWMERKLIGAEGAAFDLGIVDRGLIAGRVTWFYLHSLFWPVNLTFIYPRWRVDRTDGWQYQYPAAALGALTVLWKLRQRRRGPRSSSRRAGPASSRGAPAARGRLRCPPSNRASWLTGAEGLRALRAGPAPPASPSK